MSEPGYRRWNRLAVVPRELYILTGIRELVLPAVFAALPLITSMKSGRELRAEHVAQHGAEWINQRRKFLLLVAVAGSILTCAWLLPLQWSTAVTAAYLAGIWRLLGGHRVVPSWLLLAIALVYGSVWTVARELDQPPKLRTAIVSDDCGGGARNLCGIRFDRHVHRTEAHARSHARAADQACGHRSSAAAEIGSALSD